MTTPQSNETDRAPKVRAWRSGLRSISALAAALAMALLGILLWPKHASHKSERLPEVPRSELFLREGRLYQMGQSNAFAGFMVETYANGSLKSRSMISNGVLHGVSEGWHTNGQIQVVEHFKEGVSHGIRTKHYPSGTRMSEATIVEGKLQDNFRRWYEDGTLAEQVALNAGQPHGLSFAYFQSGFLKTKATLQHGKAIKLESWKDGEFKSSPIDALQGP